jgi:hypothetical protein
MFFDRKPNFNRSESLLDPPFFQPLPYFQLTFHFISLQQLQLAQMSADMSRDELHGLSVSGGESSSGGGASPLTARSIRLERFAQALANSQEELRR